MRKRAIFFGVGDGRDSGDTDALVEAVLAEQGRPAPTAWAAIRDPPETTAVYYEALPYPRSPLT